MAKVDKDELNQLLVNAIQKFCHPANLVAGNKEIKIRCPYCGDSIKSASHTHMYIGLSDEYYFPYYCQRCTTGGIVDRNFLKDNNVLDYYLMGLIESFNKTNQFNRAVIGSSFSNYTVKGLIQRQKLLIPSFKGTSREKAKLDYINSRYSFDKDPEEYIDKYKVIFSFKRFIEENEIEELFVNDYMLTNLIRNYIGFLSSDQSYIIFRNIDPNCSKHERYYMYNIFNNPNGKRFYTANSKVDILTPSIKLIMAEGPFDIIGIREYFKSNDNDDTIFASVNGKGYGLIVNHFARLGFLNMDIEIFSDSDVDIRMYRNLKRKYLIMKYNKIKVNYNMIDKDFGTKFERIKLKSNFI